MNWLVISKSTYETVLHEKHFLQEGRIGNICLFHTRHTLQDESRVIRFFISWGGESIYNNHENDSLMGKELRRIGMPCIVITNQFISMSTLTGRI